MDQGVLAREVAVDVRAGDADLGGDVLHPGPGEAPPGEADRRGASMIRSRECLHHPLPARRKGRRRSAALVAPSSSSIGHSTSPRARDGGYLPQVHWYEICSVYHRADDDDLGELSAGRPALSRARSIWVLAVLCAGVGLVTAALCSLYAVGPDLARATGASQSELTWIIDAYTLVMAGLLLPAGALGDRFGRKGVLLAGLGLFVVVSTALCFVDSPSGLIALRALLGVAAAARSCPRRSRSSPAPSRPSSATRRSASGPRRSPLPAASRSSCRGSCSSSSRGSRGSGASRLGALVVFVATLTVPTSRETMPPPIDVPGSIAAMVSISALVYGLIQAGLDGWTSPNDHRRDRPRPVGRGRLRRHPAAQAGPAARRPAVQDPSLRGLGLHRHGVLRRHLRAVLRRACSSSSTCSTTRP